MRRLGTLGDAAKAERFAAALRGRGTAIDLRPEPDGTVGVWVIDEDRLAATRDELVAFEANPGADRFRTPAIPPVPREQSPPPATVRERTRPPMWRRLPVTLTLIGISVSVSLVIWLAPEFESEAGARLNDDLRIASLQFVFRDGALRPGSDGLNDIRSGQVWRLVTPIFPHGGPIHLLFNMAWLWLLGGAFETVRGSVRLLLFVLVTAVASNVAEYYFNLGFTFDMQNGLQSQTGYKPDPFFLGMSGVVFGLFGFVWMRSRLFPSSGFMMPRDTVVWMLIWLLVCTSGLVGPIANVAHGVGLIAGMAFGAAPRLWRRRKT